MKIGTYKKKMLKIDPQLLKISLTGVSEITCIEARKATASAGLVQSGL